MKNHSSKLILISGIFLILFVLAGFISSVKAATLLLNPTYGNVKAGDNLKVDVVIKAEGENQIIDGVDANIAYDVDVLKVKELKQGRFFSTYPIFKEESGQVKITALAPKEGVRIFGEIIIASLEFEVYDNSETKLELVYRQGATGDSNVAEHGSARDILSGVTNGSYKVEATDERLQQTRLRKARQSGLVPVIIFIILIIIVGIGIWYYRKKRKPKEDYFVPEAFPMDELPKTEGNREPENPKAS